jgi:hypothetical protein
MKESSLEVRHKIHLGVGECYQHSLKGLGSAGYVWEVQTEGAEEAITLSREKIKSSPLPPAGSAAPDTSSMDDLIHVEAKRPGTVTVRLVQRRPWEQDVPPLNTVSFDITVV